MSNLNVPTITPNQAIDTLRVCYLLRQPIMIHGPSGQGKTTIVKELAQQLKAELILITVPQKQPGDFVVPFISEAKEKLIHYLTELIPTDPNVGPTIVLLDELGSALPEVQVIAHEPLENRTLGGKPVSPNVYFVATGNSLEDDGNYHVYEMGEALIKRLVHIRVECLTNSWIEDFAEPKGIAREIILFLKSHPVYLNESNPKGTNQANPEPGKVNPCPRSWAGVSNILKLYNRKNNTGFPIDPDKEFFTSSSEEDQRVLEALEDYDFSLKTLECLIAGRLGETVKTEFFTWLNQTKSLPPMEELFEAKEEKLKELLEKIDHPAALYGLCYSATGYANDLEHLIKAAEIFSSLVSIRDGSGLPRSDIESMAQEILLKKAMKLKCWKEYYSSSAMEPYRKKASKMQQTV